MRETSLVAVAIIVMIAALNLSLSSVAMAAAPFSSTVVFSEAGFPAADTAGPPSQLSSLFPGARFAASAQLGALLGDPATRLLVMPYGSAFPEGSWADIFAFVNRGGNLLVLGGRPFTRSAYHDATGWKLR